MTGQLRTTLRTRADDIETWDVDVDTIVRDGHRRVRRRQVALAGGVAAVLAVTGGLTALVGRDHTGNHVPPADQDVKPLTYAVGSVIHSGDTTVDVGERVVTLVQTHWGFVFSTPDRELHQIRDGQVEPLDTFGEHPSHLAEGTPRLVVSDDGLLTSWFDGSRIQTWPGYRPSNGEELDALDKTNSFNAANSWTDADPPRIEAVSDGHLWFWDGFDTWTAEVRPLTSTAGWKDAGFSDPEMIRSVVGDRVLIRVGGGMAVVKANLLPPPHQPGWAGWEPGTDVSGVRAQVSGVTDGVLSPDGDHWFTHDGGQFAVYDSTTGDGQEPTHDGFVGVTPYQWLGNDTIAAFGSRSSAPGGPVSLLTCRVSTNDCTVAAADVGTADEVVVPDGLPAGSD